MRKKTIQKIIYITLFLNIFSVIYSQQTENENDLADISEFRDFLVRAIHHILASGSHAQILTATTSSASLSKLPHFQVGLGAGVSVGIGIFEILDAFESEFGKQFPGVGVGLLPYIRFGGYGIPFDVGIYFRYLPELSFWSLKYSSTDIGLDFRYGFLSEEEKDFFDFSVGLRYFYSNSKIKYSFVPSNYKAKDMRQDPQDVKVSFSSNFVLSLWNATNIISVPVQISKAFSFFEPYMGVEPFITISSLNLTNEGDITIISDTEYNYKRYADTFETKLDSDIFGNSGLSYKRNAFNGGFRVYTGFSLKFLKMYWDIQFGFEPINAEAGFATGFRFQW